MAPECGFKICVEMLSCNLVRVTLCLVLILTDQAFSKPPPKTAEDQTSYEREEQRYGGSPVYQSDPDYPSDPDYQSDDYQKDPYPETKKKCETYYDVEYEDKCIKYNDKVCYTNYQEHCDNVIKDNCKPLIQSEQVRKCTNVTELLCGLTESVKYEMATASYTVQKCHKVKERVCDTVYEPEIKSQDDYHCIQLKTYKCQNKEETMYDKTCRHITKHYCDSGDSYGSSDYKSGSGNDAYNAYGGESGDYHSAGGYGGEGEYGNDYQEPKCTTSQEVKCYETPRTVPTLQCTDGYEKVCEKFAENVPYAGEKQACHDEDKRVCEMEVRHQPKQIQRYVYKKTCKKVPREICSSADMKQLVPSCAPTTYKNCHYEPHEKCEHIPKEHCFKVPKKVKKQRCYNEYETQYSQETDHYSQAKPSYDKY